jgi:hypothetical protein
MPHFPEKLASTGTRHRPRRLLDLRVELLECRELMTSSSSPLSLSSLIFQAPPAKNPPLVPRTVSSELPKNVSGRIQGLYELSLTKHPLYQGTVLGHVVKAPMFNPGYTGDKRLNLDVVGTSARTNGPQGLVLTGDVLGPINPVQPAIYSFLINRGGSSASGSIQGRPISSYDLEVRVTDGPGGPIGSVSLLNSQLQTTSTVSLPRSNVQVNGKRIQVTVLPGLLPLAAPPGTQPTTMRNFYVFEASVPGGQPSDLAGFAPGYITSKAVHPVTASR